jgi:hypothetical protein
MKKLYHLLYVLIAMILCVCSSMIGCNGGGSDPSACGSGSISCGNPVGGPQCCPTGNNCCFGYNLCCPSNTPHLGRRLSDGAKMCYPTLQGEGSTWVLLTVCGVPADPVANEVCAEPVKAYAPFGTAN